MMVEKSFCVYVLRDPIGKVYVGMTSQKPTSRWREGRGYANQKKLFDAIQQYGWESFSHEIVAEGLSLSDAKNLEIKLIDEFKSMNDEFGYNTSNGGECTSIGIKRPGEKAAFYGHKHSDEARERIGASQRGEKHHFFGKHHSIEARQKMSEARRGEKHYMYGKRPSERSIAALVE